MSQTTGRSSWSAENASPNARVLRTLFENSTEEVVRYDRGFARLYANAAHARAMRSKVEELVGRPIGEPATEERRDEIEKLTHGLTRAFEDRAETVVEFTRLTPEGAQELFVRLVPEALEDGRVESVFVLSRDVTESYRVRDAAHRTEILLEGIAEGTDDMIAAEDYEFRYLYVNDAYRREFRKLWKSTPGPGTSMIEAMAPWPEEQARARALWARALAGESFTETVEFGPSEDERYIYELRFNPIHDAEGNQIGAAHIFRNVTEQVRIAETLREAQERHRLVNLSTYEVIWDWDLVTDKLSWSGSVEPVFGVTRDELGHTVHGWKSRIHPDDHERVVTSIHAAIDGTDDSWVESYRFRCANGTWKTFLDRGHIARTENGTA